ncbi:MAG: hypothetical protein ACP5NS_00480 [Candidatus Pacearchaeota archaeon]
MVTRHGRDLISVVNLKGWNFYDSADIREESDSDMAIKVGPVSDLQDGRCYVLLPVSERPKDPVSIRGAQERVAVALNRDMPTVKVYGIRHPLTGIRVLESNQIKFNTPEGLVLPYGQAVVVARTLFDTKHLRYDE